MGSSPDINLSIFISQILGVLYLTVGMGLLLFREAYMLALRKLLDHHGYSMLGGFMAIVGGMAMVNYHNMWVNDWRVIITLISWIVLIQGTLIVLIPSYSQAFKSLLKVRIGAELTIAILILGVFFCYFGFIY